MSGRKKRPEDEGKGHKVPPKGPEVFKAQRNPHALIPVRRLSDGKPAYLSVRWPASNARSGPPDPPVISEVIRMDDKAKVRITYPDPYLAAEARVAKKDAA